MSVYPTFARHVLAPAYDLLRGTQTMRSLSELEASQWWPAARIEELQSERLQRLTHYAYERVPYYRRLMDSRGISPDSIKTAADLPLLPVLFKSDVREHADELLAQGFPRRELVHGRTGGSTGTPLTFYSSRENRYSHGVARALRALQWAGVHPGDATIRVATQGSRGYASRLGAPARFLSRETFEDSAGFSDSSLPLIVERIARLRPRALRGFPSALCIIAEFIRESGTRAPEVGAVVTGAEQLFDEQRALLRDVFGSEPFNKYSSYENFDIASECEAHAGLHVAAEDLIVEVVDDEGHPVEPGRQGLVVITGLHEYGLPLIRYCTDDESSLLEGTCECGRSLPRLSNVIGKTGNIIHTPSGKRLSPFALHPSGIAPLGVRQFQFIQERLDHVTVRVVPNTCLSVSDSQALAAAVRSNFGSTLGDDVLVDVLVVDRIEPTPAGKHLFLISKVQRPPAVRPQSTEAL
ncbi:MAG: hypothetical protein M0R22_02600 [Dehalococcoidia bacterium]|jgi:phenylacetate-CoA ligase|nr:hypothetical protein [Dehalococcoidia bacterium]